MEPNASPGPKSKKSDDSQTSVDAHDEASFSPADNINNDSLQPYAVTRCQQDDEVSIKMPENIEDNPLTQPHAVTYQKHDEIAIESADCDVVQPYAVQYEDETVGDSANNDGNPGIQRSAINHQKNEEPFLGPLNCDGGQPYAVKYHEDDDSGSAMSKTRHTVSIGPEDEVIQPYAVAYMCQGVNDVSTSPSSNDVLHALDPNPMYAAADMCQGDVWCNTASGDSQASLSSQNQNQPTAASNNINDVSTSPSSNDFLHALDPNPMYAAADMCQGDVGWNTASGETQASLSSQNQNQPTAASNNINDVSTSPSSNDVLHALDPNPMYAAADMCQGDVGWNTASGETQASLSSQNQPAAASNSINNANDFLHALHPNPMYVPNVRVPTAHGCTRRRVCIAIVTAAVLGLFIVAGVLFWLYLSAGTPQPEKITFGGQGKEPGKFLRKKDYGFGVAVSADNEIFVTDHDNKRVQVFSINGTYLRLFPTVVPGESMTMFPYSVTLDVGPGYLWVLGKGDYEQQGSDMCYKGHVVQYSKNGQPIKKFDVSLIISFYPVIAMDVRNNKVIVGDGYTITMFDPNGSRFWSSNVRTAFGIGGVIWDKEGNILLTDGDETVKKYNQSGVKIFEFGTYGKAKGQLDSPKGICLDSSGHIIVANTKSNRVDMLTRQGEFVRTIADIMSPWGVAMGPCGDLVVTSSHTHTVTIFPRHMVGP
ncbi:hypothetical protein Bbelb_288100 [Branchiostoma belcheri]|nr:hypothetical protein Bbelb_288100 [Branchiostoma belcheri]